MNHPEPVSKAGPKQRGVTPSGSKIAHRPRDLAQYAAVEPRHVQPHHVRERQQRLERPEADDLVGDLLEHPDALGAGQGEAFLVDDLAEDLLDLAPDLDLVGQVELRVQILDDPALDPELDVAERLPDRRLAHQTLRRRRATCADKQVEYGALMELMNRLRAP